MTLTQQFLTASLPTTTRRPGHRIALNCQECGKTFVINSKTYDPRCPRCGSVDVEVVA